MKLYAAPLQGFTEAPWRNLHQEVFGGIDAYYTPFVRMEKGEFRNKDVRDIAPENNALFPCSEFLSSSRPSCRAGTAGRFVYRERVQGSGYQYGLSFSPDDRNIRVRAFCRIRPRWKLY